MSYLENLLANVNQARQQWNEFSGQIDDAAEFSKRFHLRPTSTGVTIVSTLPEKPMRGKKVGKTVVKKRLNKLYGITKSDISKIDKLKMLTELGFQDRKRGGQRKKEEAYQARMIAEMSENYSLKAFLNVDKLLFVASEFIIHDQQDSSDRQRIDVIAYDGKGKLFFFELKTPDSNDDPVGQVIRYINKYGEAKREELLQVLKRYPVHSVKQDDITIEGYAVYGYGDEVNENESVKAGGQGGVGVIRF